MLNILPHDEYGGDPDSFEIMANFPFPLLPNALYGHDCMHYMRRNFVKCEQELLAVSSIKSSVMWWLNFVSCLVKHPVVLWGNNYYAIDGKHRVTGKQIKGWWLSLPQNWGFSLCYSILRLTHTQVSCLKDDLISWFSLQNTGSPIFLFDFKVSRISPSVDTFSCYSVATFCI